MENSQKPLAFYGLATTASIDGVAKISLQAKIFAPGKIDASIDGVTKKLLQASVFVPGKIDISIDDRIV